MRFIVMGHIGSDAGYWYWDGSGWHHVGGWAVEQLAEFQAAVNIMRESTNFKTPGLAAAATKVVAEFAEKQLGAHIKEAGKEGGGVVVIA
jgi:hypothetical protein